MAKKKILQDKDGQIWPVTVVDCVYLVDGSKTIKNYIDDGLASKAGTSHGNHVPTTQTADNTKFLRNDNTWQSVTPANIGALSRQYKTAATAATAGWYRIATSVAGIARNMAMFEIDATVSGKHSVSILAAGICYGQAPTLNQLAHTEHSNTGISKVRVVYHTTYSGNYAYLEVYVPTATATTLNVKMIEGFGWSLTAPSTAGSIPDGYTNKEITLVKNKIVADIQGNVSGSSGSCTGNAATATKFASAQSVALTGDVTGSASSQAGWSVATTLANSGVTAGSYGPNANASPAHSGTFSVPYITVDAKGRVTAASTKTITLPSDNNTDTKVTYTLDTTTKYYMGGPTATATGTGGITFDTGIYATTTAGQLSVGSLQTRGAITTSGNGSHSIGSTSNRFSGIYGANIYAYDTNAQHYASLRTTTVGTADTQGVGRLVAGNNVVSGTAGNAKGQVLLYGTDTGYTAITPGNNTTSSITLTLPSSGGTLARTVDNVASASKVHTTLDTTTKAYLLGTSTAPTSTSTAVSTIGDTGVYLTTTAGQLQVTGGLISGSTVRSDTAVTDNLGTSTVPWKYIYGQHHYINNDATGTNYGRFFVQTAGTTSAVGNGRITLGNSTASGTVNNAQGSICLYGSDTGYTIINPGNNSTSSVTITLPSATGKIPIMVMDDADYWGILPPTGTESSWLRSPKSGLLPFEKYSEMSSIGTSSWPWYNICGKNFISYDKNGQSYAYMRVVTDGTADTNGEARLQLGNNISTGAAKNAYGRIQMYGTNTGYTMITPGNNTTSNITLTLPSSTGTLATTANLSSYLPLAGGTMTGPIKRSYTTSWVNGTKTALITSTATAGGFQPMMAGVTTNGSMTLAYYNNKLTVGYLTKENVDAGTNVVSQTATLFDESGNATWTGTVTSSNIVTQGISLKGASGNDTEAHTFVFYDDSGSEWFVPADKPGFHVGDQGCGLYFCGNNISFCYFSDDTTISTSSLDDEDVVEAMCSPDDIGKRKPDAIYNIYHEGFNPTPEAVGALSIEGGTVTGETTFESVVTADTIYSTNAINISSDRNLKENIKYISSNNINLLNEENDSDNISLKDMYDFVKDELGLASYTMKNNKENKKKINFIAQDLLYNNNNEDSKVGQLIVNAEHAVNEDTTLSYDLGNYNSIIAGALQYAIIEIENLKAEIEELKSK